MTLSSDGNTLVANGTQGRQIATRVPFSKFQNALPLSLETQRPDGFTDMTKPYGPITGAIRIGGDPRFLFFPCSSSRRVGKFDYEQPKNLYSLDRTTGQYAALTTNSQRTLPTASEFLFNVASDGSSVTFEDSQRIFDVKTKDAKPLGTMVPPDCVQGGTSQ